MSARPEPMTVGELRDRLANYHDATPVMVSGYEGGFDYPSVVRLADAKKDHGDVEWYFGRFKDVRGPEVVGSREVVVIER
jgi:hypothetical protein